jgi:uncharacterized protein YndB with AHSA1/START domain
MPEPSVQLSLDVDRLIDARPATVFRLLTEPELYARWFGPPGATVTVEEMELTLGGRLLVLIELDGGVEVRIEGYYEVIDPPNLIVHTWRGVGEDLVTTVRFELEPQGEQTRLRIVHVGFVDPVELEQHQRGWLELLDAIAALAPDIG